MSAVANSPSDDHCLSIVLSGGIALGAFHAGTIAQIGWFLRTWQDARAEDPSLPPIFVDVISGASAGALTGAVLFQYIGTDYYATKGLNPGEDKQAFLKASYDAWCGPQLTFANMLNRATKDDERSVLSNNAIEDLAATSITDLEPRLPQGQDRLLFTCTMTSIEPIPFEIELPDATRKVTQTTLYGETRKDWITFQMTAPTSVPSGMESSAGHYTNLAHATPSTVFMELASSPNTSPTNNNREELWKRLKFSAMASGAFPFAWSPIFMSRNLRYYPAAARGEASTHTESVFEYMDGGVINNMPLDRAAKVIRDYALKTDAVAGVSKRTYVLIDVSPAKQPSARPHLINNVEPSRNRNRPIATEAGPMIEALREQGYFRDLLDAQHTNERLIQRTDVLWPLLQRYISCVAPDQVAAELAHAIEELDRLLMGKKSVSNPLDAERMRVLLGSQLRIRHPEFFPGKDLPREELLEVLMITADSVADLAGKHELEALRIQPSKTLKSAFFGDFGGFVDQTLMRDDFWHGMQSAKKSIEEWLGVLLPEKSLPVLFCPFADFAKVAGQTTLNQSSIEEYYNVDPKVAFQWSDAPHDSQVAFLRNLGGRGNKLVGGLGESVYAGIKFLASGAALVIALVLLAMAVVVDLFLPVVGGWLGLVLGLIVGASAVGIFLSRLIWPILQRSIPKPSH